ncbi:hypothetical protein RND81_08G210500 [Saponaria officinalis]|uniref:RING-type E3 ubiquitin transferase n=1 Tax=Saponaria officinalis TaxID=3572 RepID=A0AAW1JAH9_SAPOF
MAFSGTRRLMNHLPHLTTQDETNSHLLHLHYSELDDKNFKIHGQTLFYLFILFSLTLLVTLILLYARWYFRFRHLHAPPIHPHAPHAPPTRPAKGLDEAVIKAMPILLHQNGGGVEMECCICLGVFDDGDKVKVLDECQHRFHSDCVDRWLLSQPTCPLCRVSLKPPPPSDLELGGEL